MISHFRQHHKTSDAGLTAVRIIFERHGPATAARSPAFTNLTPGCPLTRARKSCVRGRTEDRTVTEGGKRAWESTAGSLEERELAQCTGIGGAHAYPCGFETLRTSV